jgi:hypothetical protein
MIGKFLARVKEIGISKTKAGLPQVVANFTCFYEEGEGDKKETKKFEKVGFFSLKGEAAPITLQTLVILGYKFTVNDLSDIAAGSGVDFSKEIEIVIADNTYDGKTTEQIKGVYEVGTAGFQSMKPNEAVALMKGLDISGTVLSFMQTKGITKGGGETTPASKTTADQNPDGTAKKLPF